MDTLNHQIFKLQKEIVDIGENLNDLKSRNHKTISNILNNFYQSTNNINNNQGKNDYKKRTINNNKSLSKKYSQNNQKLNSVNLNSCKSLSVCNVFNKNGSSKNIYNNFNTYKNNDYLHERFFNNNNDSNKYLKNNNMDYISLNDNYQNNKINKRENGRKLFSYAEKNKNKAKFIHRNNKLNSFRKQLSIKKNNNNNKENDFLSKNKDNNNKINEFYKLLECDNLDDCKEKINKMILVENFINEMEKICDKKNNDLNEIVHWVAYLYHYNFKNKKYEEFCKNIMKEYGVVSFEEFKQFIDCVLKMNRNNNFLMGEVKKILNISTGLSKIYK